MKNLCRVSLLLSSLLTTSSWAATVTLGENQTTTSFAPNCLNTACIYQPSPWNNGSIDSKALAQKLAASDVVINVHHSTLVIGDDTDLSWQAPHKLTIIANSITMGNNVTLGLSGSNQKLFIKTNKITLGDEKPTINIGSNEHVEILQHPTNYKQFAQFNVNKDASAQFKNAIWIMNLAELQAVNNNPAANYILLTDIDGQGATFTPLGGSGPFKGKFYGNNHVISNLNIQSSFPNQLGLFAWVYDTASVINLGASNINAPFAARNDGNIDSCYLNNINFTFTNINNYDMGGFISDMYAGSVTNSYVTGTLTSTNGSSVGGFIGNLMGGTISNSYSSVNITVSNGAPLCGGFAGEVSGGGTSIEQSASSGNIVGNANQTGGFAGFSGVPLANDYATGNVSNTATQHSTVGAAIGGFAGELVNTVQDSYSTGNVTVPYPEGIAVGGFSGRLGSSLNMSSNYWDTDTAGQSKGVGIPAKGDTPPQGVTDAQMKTQSTFTNWNFSTIWTIQQGITYPYFIWQSAPLVKF